MRLFSKTVFISALFIFFFSPCSKDLYAATAIKKINHQWFVSVRSGIAMFHTEFTPDFRVLKNEFNHSPGILYDFSVSRTFGNRWEAGSSLDIYKIKGQTATPAFSAIGVHSSCMDLYPGIPVEYDNISNSLLFFFRCYLLDFSRFRRKSVTVNPYFEIGGGVHSFSSRLKYQFKPPTQSDRIIFQKAGDNKGNVAQLSAGLGAKMKFIGESTLIVSVNTEFVDYDCLDGVHNYTDRKRNHARTVVARYMGGIVIPLNGRTAKRSNKNFLPWAPH